MIDASSRDRISANIARKLLTHAAAGSPYQVHLLARGLRRFPVGVAAQPSLLDHLFFLKVCQSIFVCSSPKITLGRLQACRESVRDLDKSVFGLCGVAIMHAVYARNWPVAQESFQAAAELALRSAIPFLLEAVAGLRERFLLLPRDGCGVRATGSAKDLLWQVNLAEEHFCAGRLRDSLKLADHLEANFPSCGWASTLRVRNLLLAGRIKEAHRYLREVEPGVIPAGEALAWETLLHGLATQWRGRNPFYPFPGNTNHYLRLPFFFQGLISLFRGDDDAARRQFEQAVMLSEPAALMHNFDPLLRAGYHLKAREAGGCP